MNLIVNRTCLGACLLGLLAGTMVAEEAKSDAKQEQAKKPPEKAAKISWGKLLDDSAVDTMVEKKIVDKRMRRIKAETSFKKGDDGKYTYRVTAGLYEYKKGSSNPKRLSGTLRIYVVGADNKIAQKTSMSLAKMCPS